MKKSIEHIEKRENPIDKHEEPLIAFLHIAIRFSVRVLAVLMVLVIFWGVADVVYVMYKQLMEPPVYLLSLSDIFQTFAAFLAVLIAIEIFENIVLYLRTDVVPVKLVVATALMAIARKVIILDFSVIGHMYIFATGFVVITLGVTYYLLGKKYD